MKKESFSFLRKWQFWIGFQVFLIVLLNILVLLNAGPENTPTDPLQKTELMFFNACMTILGFPTGIYFLFHEARGAVSGFSESFFAFVLPIIYYPVFLSLVWYITKGKKYWNWISVGLLIFMLLSFSGCASVTDLQLVVH